MRNSIWTLFVLTILSSCSPEKQLARLLKKNPYLLPKTDSVRTWIESRCDSVEVPVPYQEFGIDTASPCPPEYTLHKSFRQGLISVFLDIRNGDLKIRIVQDSAKTKVEIKTNTVYKDQVRLIKQDIPIRDSRYYFYLSGFWILLVIVLLTIAGLIYVK